MTIHGTTYNGVAGIRYIKNGVTKEVSKLILNGSSIWTGSGGTTPVEPTLPEKKVFSEMTWADIQTVCKAGKASEYWSIGDTHALYADGTYNVQIIGFDHDTPADTSVYGRNKAGITVEMVNCFDASAAMNNSNSTIGGWESCNMRSTILSELLTSISEGNSLSQYICPVVKSSSGGGTVSSASIVTTTDNFFILSEIEILGTSSYSVEGEGEQYTWYKTNNATKVKESAPGKFVTRWTRSAYTIQRYAIINAMGSAANVAPTTTTVSYTVAFCV